MALPIPRELLEVDALFLSNSAEVQNGLAYVLGGAWTRCWPVQGVDYPYERQIPTVAILRVPWPETNIEHNFKVAYRDADGNDLIPPAVGGFKVGRQPDLTDGASQVVVAALAAPVKLPKTGLYYVVVEIDGVEKKRIQFEAIRDPNAPRLGRS